MPKRTRLAPGIFSDAYGISVIVSVHGTPEETRFEKDRPLELLKRWRARRLAEVADAAKRDPRGSLARDVVTFLKTRKGIPNYKTEKSNLKAWVRALDNPPRWTITAAMILETMATWRDAGYSPQTLRHRMRILRQLFRTLDGSRAPSPFDDLELPAKPRARPVAPADSQIVEVAQQLRKQEILRRQDGKTRARFLVLATTGRRPAELKRTARADVDLDRRLWFARGAKGGYSTIVTLNDEQYAAWQLFAEVGAWGDYNTRSFSATIQRAGWPKGIRVYNVRHAVAYAIRRHGGDAVDVKHQLGHATLDTGQFYFGQDPARAAAVSAALEGRLGKPAFSPAPLPRPTSTTAPDPPAKGRDYKGKYEMAADRPKRRR